MPKAQPKTIRDHNDFLRKFKVEVATDLNLLGNITENNTCYKGNVSCKENGKQGGSIGGQMTKKMIDYSKKTM